MARIQIVIKVRHLVNHKALSPSMGMCHTAHIWMAQRRKQTARGTPDLHLAGLQNLMHNYVVLATTSNKHELMVYLYR